MCVQMSGQKYLRTNFDDDDDHLVDSSPGAAVSGVSPVDGSGIGGGLDSTGRPSPHISVYTTTVAFGGVDSGPAVSVVHFFYLTHSHIEWMID